MVILLILCTRFLTKIEALTIVETRLIALLYALVSCLFGEMSERSKEAVLKTVEARVSGGSNPSLSVHQSIHWYCFFSLERCESGRIGLPAKELTW